MARLTKPQADKLLKIAREMLAKARDPKLDAAITSAVNKPQQKLSPEQLAAVTEKMKAKAAMSRQKPMGSPLASEPVATGAPPMSLKDFHGELERHDWHHTSSDNQEVWSQGNQNAKKLAAVAGQSPEHKAMYDAFKQHMFSGPAFGSPKSPKPQKPV